MKSTVCAPDVSTDTDYESNDEMEEVSEEKIDDRDEHKWEQTVAEKADALEDAHFST